MIDFTDEKLKAEFEAEFIVDDWLCWKHRTNKPSTKSGHTRLTFHGVRDYGHRFAMAFKLGRPLEDGEVVRHLCGNAYCANPECLALGDAMDNFEDELR